MQSAHFPRALAVTPGREASRRAIRGERALWLQTTVSSTESAIRRVRGGVCGAPRRLSRVDEVPRPGRTATRRNRRTRCDVWPWRGGTTLPRHRTAFCRSPLPSTSKMKNRDARGPSRRQRWPRVFRSARQIPESPELNGTQKFATSMGSRNRSGASKLDGAPLTYPGACVRHQVALPTALGPSSTTIMAASRSGFAWTGPSLSWKTQREMYS
jgi:hypothetical protein